MKIVTYNVNGLRNRISQYGSLLKLLNSLDADIICFQETKLSKQELRADVVWADGYESFFSCTRTSNRGRTGYSGVATLCRVKSAFSSNEVALPLDAEEGFTGTLDTCRGFGATKDEVPTMLEGLEDFERDELCKIDSEGRCIITDHGHFVLFNIYNPRADPDDAYRIHHILQDIAGVATFCRVKSAFSSNAEEEFAGTLDNCLGFGAIKDEIPTMLEGLEDFETDQLHKIDSEGRCIITDHGHFVLFNIYDPRADPDDI